MQKLCLLLRQIFSIPFFGSGHPKGPLSGPNRQVDITSLLIVAESSADHSSACAESPRVGSNKPLCEVFCYYWICSGSRVFCVPNCSGKFLTPNNFVGKPRTSAFEHCARLHPSGVRETPSCYMQGPCETGETKTVHPSMVLCTGLADSHRRGTKVLLWAPIAWS